MANPPFNVNGVDKERLDGDPRFPFGMPTGRQRQLPLDPGVLQRPERDAAAPVSSWPTRPATPGAASWRSAGSCWRPGAVDVMVAIGTNFFYTVTLPCTLWFLDRGKRDTTARDTVLFIDARQIYRQIDRAHRDFRPEQIEFLANIVRLYRGEEPETVGGSEQPHRPKHFPDGAYLDVPGLCKVATLAEIEAQGWSLNPGRYVGVLPMTPNDFDDFAAQMAALSEEWASLTLQAHDLEERVRQGIQSALVTA